MRNHEAGCNDETLNNRLFFVIRKKEAELNKEFSLVKGDVIKLGRIKFKIKDFRTKL